MTPKGYKFHDDVLVPVEKVGPTQSAELRAAASRTIGRWELRKRKKVPDLRPTKEMSQPHHQETREVRKDSGRPMLQEAP